MPEGCGCNAGHRLGANPMTKVAKLSMMAEKRMQAAGSSYKLAVITNTPDKVFPAGQQSMAALYVCK